MKDVNIFLAFSAGVLSFLSPCALSLMPGYLGYLMGLNKDEGKDINKKSIMVKAFLFVIGFTLVFTLMGLTITSIGRFLVFNKKVLTQVGGVFVIILGIQTMGISRLKVFKKEKKAIKINFRKREFGPFILGVAFAAGWTPCISVISSSIAIYASNAESFTKGVILLIFYSIGLAVPFLLSALLLTRAQEKFILMKKYSKGISIVSGILLIIMGLLLFFDKFEQINSIF
ncbi:cytochrome c biogenesis CcdA family protein [Oceanirhabdus seepicola]|uniref:Sulfite exporter TauE/SafE family protein n=1 Tax=Oceanirhabdus seepicola TaxID=2828781 RepID=A0A9J6P203_9CLOT|nr:cytochrome c biogenesis protein CcdA [Oceanirhabdus seepicola]MCM1989917.1 sulfite exporter TauE/SafE family protein [Oceanirhabdus seepicola]